MPNLKEMSDSIKTYEPTVPQLVSSKLLACITSIAHIVLGSVYFEDCPVQHYIPIYLIVSGTLFLVAGILTCLPCKRCGEDTESSKLSKFCCALNTLMFIGLVGWFIAGNVWVYSIYEPIYVKNATTTEVYCNKTLYLYAFWTMTITYICICLFLPLALCCCLCACICNKSMFGSFGARVPTNPAPL
ncbi:hypothetical protein FQA47_008926 [Oryzias melastigma]|uniref:Uncharacterized protein n=1 Tax=Oryzias melastigma TaxID=30732 RepID=A0A834BTG9_ORYME|nr:hypothetical protein FQA47_008926 [Oryzias melastigma]